MDTGLRILSRQLPFNVSFDLSIGTRLREKDCIKEIKGYDNRLLVHVSRAYRSSSIGIPGRPVSAPYVGDWDTLMISAVSCLTTISDVTSNGVMVMIFV